MVTSIVQLQSAKNLQGASHKTVNNILLTLKSEVVHVKMVGVNNNIEFTYLP